MFIHREQLEYQLTPELYVSPEHYRCERDQLLRPGWQLVGIQSELPKSGDFKTIDVLETPLQIRNFEGEIYAYLNVCSHRHCKLTDEPTGHSERLTCQYHGWEYDVSGQVRKVPDGGCFKPLDRRNSRLVRFPVETLGELIFVQLDDSGRTLQEQLGPYYESVRERSQSPWAVNWTWQHEFDCNWKIPVENTLETYHLPFVHENTFGGIYPTEKQQTHELHDDYTSLVYRMDPTQRLNRLQHGACRRLGVTPRNHYIHFHAHPNLVFTFTDLFMHTQVYLPVSPTKSKTWVWMFSRGADRKGLRARLTSRIVAWYGRRSNTAIQLEDASIFADQQAGIQASPHPGCLGTREERIYMFHRYLLSHVRSPVAPAPSDLPAVSSTG